MKLEQTLKYLIKKNPFFRCEYKHLQKSIYVHPFDSNTTYVNSKKTNIILLYSLYHIITDMNSAITLLDTFKTMYDGNIVRE